MSLQEYEFKITADDKELYKQFCTHLDLFLSPDQKPENKEYCYWRMISILSWLKVNSKARKMQRIREEFDKDSYMEDNYQMSRLRRMELILKEQCDPYTYWYHRPDGEDRYSIIDYIVLRLLSHGKCDYKLVERITDLVREEYCL